MLQHTTDSEWNCNDCAHQTNSEDSLKEHLDNTHHKSKQIKSVNQEFPCNHCTANFTDRKELEEHRKQLHKSFKPCRNLPDCQYAENCIFNHEEVKNKLYLCYECGVESKTLGELMNHRKNNHTMNTCTKFQENMCKFTSESCWYSKDSGILLPLQANNQLNSLRFFGFLQRTLHRHHHSRAKQHG